MEQLATLTSPRRTRATNATKHPSLPDAPASRRSHADMVADNAHQSELQALQEAKALHTLDNIVSVEGGMKALQQVKHTTTKKGVCPIKPRSVKDGATAAVVPKGKRQS